MKFDVVIIGSGLAGLACGIRLAEAGKSCAIVSAGQSALYFSSGSMDFLSHLPDGRQVTHPLAALSELAKQAPTHPYSRIGEKKVASLIYRAEELLRESGLTLTGSASQNHYRITPLGRRRMTWLTPARVPTLELECPFPCKKQPYKKQPWENVAVIGIEGFLDFQPNMVASALQKQGIKAQAQEVHLAILDRLRDNPSEFRAVNIARLLDLPENGSLLAEEIRRLSKGHDAIILPACIGLESDQIVENLQIQVGKPVYLLPTLPPSLLGIRINQAMGDRFHQFGGMVMVGDAVNGVEMEHNRITGVYTRNHGDIPLRASHVVLATGSFFNNGLKTEFDRVYEPLLGLDLLENPARGQWTRQNLFAPQPYLKFGVNTDEYLRPLKAGKAIANLYAAGSVLGGYDPLAEGCGAGVSLLSALFVAEQIISEAVTEPKSGKSRQPEQISGGEVTQ
ncbi:2-octaprenyl-3-methyl-6-methoxy-1,4-benzoquinol hydroxylase [Xenorhabdus beddingii]|uniref:Anaerobic glycerol-3-phosphate dehydrogenase subunit B n=1 Tax=Xenorhabdus beddingii TaxID=40578 RepID=A0A1Y2SMH9_9GAMM|nr:glycerol-3-phosphate dehydrogenase subunit GlpB [Xenorhabdus beddingii]OTA19321.1 2-octaprenyl-3-methyl-6-methoxy-1,4-benzoquinol hydroxylase [Xenorhabdus beddingii]